MTYKGHYNPGILDAMDSWCRDKFGDMHGECHWDDCAWSWERWHEELGLSYQLDNELYNEIKRDLNSELHCDWSSTLIREHFKMIEEEYDL